MKSIKKIPSGIDGFDILSMGGIPENRMTLLSGTPGSGKSTFCVQFLIGGINHSKDPGVFITFEESPEDIIINMKDFGLDIQKYKDSGFWEFVDISPRIEDDFLVRGDYDLSGLIIRIKNAVEKINAKRVVLDSIAVLFNRFPDKSIVRKEIIRLKSCLKSLSVTSIITMEQYEEFGKDSHYNILDFVSDNVILLQNTIFEEHRRRTIEILKYRGVPHKKGRESFTIKKNEGIIIISFERNPNELPAKRERESTGYSELDDMVGGGFFEGSSILISGQTGTGKTLITLLLLEGSLQNGEKCIMFNFEESREQILQKARNWNIDLEQPENDGIFMLNCIYPESQGIEELIVDMKSKIQSFKPDRIYIDSISALERITSNLTFRQSLINLFLFIRENNIIAIFTTTTPTFSDHFNKGMGHISTLADAIILLRYFERDGLMTRGIGILKMRDSNHSKHFIEYSIDNEGIKILKPIEGKIGIFDSF
ncbi:MAG: circadian clock protein KaiC [Promethearchaeati archaeon]